MTLTNGSKPAHAVEVSFVVNIPNVASLASFDNDGNWWVVNTDVLVLLGDPMLGQW